MLVLSRKKGQSLYIYPSPDINPDMTVAELFKDGPIKVRIVEMSRNQVKVGIDASRDLKVLRDELKAVETKPQET